MKCEISQAPNQDTNTERKRIYLNVPFSEKDEAKALGAKWDRRAKAWYARDDMELEPFKRWQETKTKAPEPKDQARRQVCPGAERKRSDPRCPADHGWQMASGSGRRRSQGPEKRFLSRAS